MGLSTAQTLFRSGYSLALLDLSQSALDSVVAELNSSAREGQTAWGKAGDVGSTPALKDFFQQARQEVGEVVGVAHCAGILGGMGPVHEQSEEGESGAV